MVARRRTIRQRVAQTVIITIAHVDALMLLALWSDELQIQSIAGAIGIATAFVLTEVAYWWLFINFLSWLPVWLYPLLTFVLSGGILVLLGNLIPGILIADFRTGLFITMVLTSVSAFLGALLSLDIDAQFDKNVTRKLVARRGNPVKTDVPGFLYLEIDGLGEKLFQRALAEGYMPTLNAWLQGGTHQVAGWETDFSAQTGAMQTGILIGNNAEIPAYRWWDRQQRRIVMTGDPRDAAMLEASLSNDQGLLSDGGASRGNMFSGDATESLFTMATLLDLKRGTSPGFYLYLVSPFVVARMTTRFLLEILKEWVQAIQQKLRKDPYIISARNPLYAFYRGLMGPLLQDLITYVVISDVLRGLPAIYALYPGYDDLGHFAGAEAPETLQALVDIDHYFARIARAIRHAPRPYHVIVLSDHGLSTGPTFQQKHGLSLEQLVKGAINADSKVYASLNTPEAWDKVNVLLNETINARSRTARVLRTMLRSKTQNGLVTLAPRRKAKQERSEAARLEAAQIIVIGSGCTGLVYFKDAQRRMTYEEIQNCYPDLILSLVQHPGIGFVMVRSVESGDLILGKNGIYFLDQGTYEGRNPLKDFSPNAPALLRRESSFSNCPDIIVNTAYDPVTEELCGFENQVSHHGGLGGQQSYPFIFYPVELPLNGEPIVGAVGVYRVLRGWRDAIQQTAVV